MTENELIRQLQHHIDQPEVLDPPPRNWRLLCRESIEAIQRLRGNKPPENETGDDLGNQIYALLVRRGYAQHEAHLIANGPGCTSDCVQKGYPEIDCPEHGGELKAFVHLCAPHGKDWLTCPECAKDAVKAGAIPETTPADPDYKSRSKANERCMCGKWEMPPNWFQLEDATSTHYLSQPCHQRGTPAESEE